MNREPTVTTVESENRSQTNVLFIDNLLAAANRLPHGMPLTYGPTPLNRLATLDQQVELADIFRNHILYGPEEIPDSIQKYVRSTFLKRFHDRAEANDENFVTALHPKAEFTDNQTMSQMITHGELGLATPTELLITRQVMGIRSVVLGCVSHPYGEPERMDLLPVMRKSVRKHVELFGGVYDDSPETRYRVKEVIGFDSGDESFRGGLLLTRKRTYATLNDGTVIRERSSFVLRTDEDSLLNEEDIEALKSVDLSSPSYQDDLVKAAHLDEIADMLLSSDEHLLAIPLSSTIYAFNPHTTELIQERDRKNDEERQARFRALWPSLADAAQTGVLMPSEYPTFAEFDEAMQGMLYIGPDLKD